MTTTHVSALDSTVNKTHQWLREIVQTGVCHDQQHAYRVLRAVLHVLRDRLVPDEAIDLAAQLPMLVRGLYYECWKPTDTPTRQRTREAFLESVREVLGPDLRIDPAEATRAVFALLDRHVSGGEIEDVTLMLPTEMRDLWPARKSSARRH